MDEILFLTSTKNAEGNLRESIVPSQFFTVHSNLSGIWVPQIVPAICGFSDPPLRFRCLELFV